MEVENLFGSEDEYFEFANYGDCEEDVRFDSIVGRIEEIIISDEFLMLKEDFLERYRHEFSSEEEIKFKYTQIFNEYQSTIEHYVERQLSDVDMDEFSMMLRNRLEEIDGVIFEMLLSFSDFQIFREIMVSANQPDQLLINVSTSIIHFAGF